MAEAPQAITLQGYFDDSGNAPTEEFFIWAGFIGSDGQMFKLSKEWNSILGQGTKIHWWHTFSAHQAIKNKTPYFGVAISDVELSAKEVELVGLLERYGKEGKIVRTAVLVNRREHERDVVSQLKALNVPLGISPALVESLKTPELIVLHRIVEGCAGIARALRATAHHTQLFFEDREGGADWQDSVCQSVRVFRKLEEPEQRYTIGSVTFVPSGKSSRINVRPLEAADMLAWHVRRQLLPGAAAEPLWPQLAAIPGQLVTISPAEMQAYVSRLNSGERPWKAPR